MLTAIDSIYPGRVEYEWLSIEYRLTPASRLHTPMAEGSALKALQYGFESHCSYAARSTVEGPLNKMQCSAKDLRADYDSRHEWAEALYEGCELPDDDQ